MQKVRQTEEAEREPAAELVRRLAELRDIDNSRFRWLETRVGLLAELDWGARLEEQRLSSVSLCGLASRSRVRSDVFDPFVGKWVGGDMHDAARAYHHQWEPVREVHPYRCQAVQMRCLRSGSVVIALNALSPRGEVFGVVGGAAHVGYPLAGGALLWLGEIIGPDGKTPDQHRFTVHLERVWASGQLYDVRGLVVQADGDTVLDCLPSDWRYHRIAGGAQM